MDEVLPELDVLYMTRVQRERFFNEEDYIRLKDSFILDAEKMKLAPKDLIVLHPRRVSTKSRSKWTTTACKVLCAGTKRRICPHGAHFNASEHRTGTF